LSRTKLGINQSNLRAPNQVTGERNQEREARKKEWYITLDKETHHKSHFEIACHRGNIEEKKIP